MPIKNQRMLTKGYIWATFSSLVSIYDHLYVMNDKIKPCLCVEHLIVSDLIVCGALYHTRAQHKCDMRPHKQTWSDIVNCSTHECGFPINSTTNICCSNKNYEEQIFPTERK